MARRAKGADPVVDDRPEDMVPDAGGDKSLHEKCVARFKVLEEYWSENRRLALEDIKFRMGEQWPEEIRRKREEKGRPIITCDRLKQYVRQVVNDARQNQPSPKYRAREDGDVEVAEAFQDLTRAILAKSNASAAFDTAIDHAAGHGFGYFRLVTDYEDDRTFAQEIYVKRIRNSLAVLLAPHQEADGSDCEDGFVIDEMSREEFRRNYPDAKFIDWTSCGKDYADGWLTELNVRVAEYFYKSATKSELYMLADGTNIRKSEYDSLVAKGAQDIPQVVNQRTVRDVKVKWCRLSGAEVLEENEFPSSYIPIFPVYGTEWDVEGKVTYEGIIRGARDPQMLYNFERTAYAERVALEPKAPWVAAEGQVENHPEWQTANVDNHSVLTYTPTSVDGSPVPPPQRQISSHFPSGLAQGLQITEHDIQSAIGMHSASIGEKSNEKSGRAIMARQREGDVSTFHFYDNLQRAVTHLGRVLIEVIRAVYDTPRVVRLRGEDGEESQAIVNSKIPGHKAIENGIKVFNFHVGHYDVDVESGPSYTTKRVEAAEAQIEIARGNPAVWQTHGDLIVKSQDWPGADEFAERTRALMPPEMRAAIEREKAGEDGQGPPPEVQAIMQQAQQEIQQRDQMLQQAMAKLDELTKAAADKAGELELRRNEIEVKRYQAETDRLKTIGPVMTPPDIAAIVEQTVRQLMTPADLDAAPPPAPEMQPPVAQDLGPAPIQ